MKQQHPTDPHLLLCTRCLIYKNQGVFYKSKKTKSGYGSWCRECDYRIKNHELAKARNRRHYRRNAERVKAKTKEYYIRNAERAKDRMRVGRKELGDEYIKKLLNQQNILINTQTIELRRYVCIKRRAVKELKKQLQEVKNGSGHENDDRYQQHAVGC